MTIAAIIPAYNEAHNISPVIDALKTSNRVDDLIVVDDGSADGTAAVAREHGARVITQSNTGKAGALATAARHSTADILLFVDADLVGFGASHVEALVRPVVKGAAGMTVGIRDRGSFMMWLMEHFLPVIGGERALRRDTFLAMVANHEQTRFGIEAVMNAYCRKHAIAVTLVRMPGVGHIIKEARYGVLTGFFARIRMIGEVIAAEVNARFK